MNQSLERDVLFHLQAAWRDLNYQIFDDQLERPMVQLIDHERTLGLWDSAKRVISLQRTLVMDSPWLEVLEVLKHEMAHQYVDEICRVHHEPPHGPTFKRVCRERGICGAASGEVTVDPQVERLLSRINKLLALAQSDNIHEAEQAAKRAQALLTQHHLKLASREDYSPLEGMRFCQLGQPKGRHYQYEYSLINLLSKHFFVSCVWVGGVSISTSKDGKIKKGRVVEACGRPEDLEVASYVYDFVLNHLKIAWDAYRKAHKVSGLRQRLSFSLGLVRGFASKLDEVVPESSGERALIQLSQQHAHKFLGLRYPHTRQRQVGGWSPSDDYHSGFETGQSLRLRRGVSQSSSNTQPKLLPGRG